MGSEQSCSKTGSPVPVNSWKDCFHIEHRAEQASIEYMNILRDHKPLNRLQSRKCDALV